MHGMTLGQSLVVAAVATPWGSPNRTADERARIAASFWATLAKPPCHASGQLVGTKRRSRR